MRRSILLVMLVMASLAALLVWHGWASSGNAGEAAGRPCPDFPTNDPNYWINSAPLSIAGMRGQVVVIDVWTYG